jgi:hypothetical protein
MWLWLEGPDINYRADGRLAEATTGKFVFPEIEKETDTSVYSLRSSLANRFQCLPLTPHVFRIRLASLLRMVERPVTIPSLIRVIIE